jgi:hypothetical protein
MYYCPAHDYLKESLNNHSNFSSFLHHHETVANDQISVIPFVGGLDIREL